MGKIISLTMFLFQIQSSFGTEISVQKCKDYQKSIGIVDHYAKMYPFMVNVLLGSDIQTNGVLISEAFALSYGVCSSNEAAMVEIDFLAPDETRSQFIAISERIKHPATDLCLLKLSQPINHFNEFIRPVCLSYEPITATGPQTEVRTNNGLEIRTTWINFFYNIFLQKLFMDCNEYLYEFEQNEPAYADSVILNAYGELAAIKTTEIDGGCNEVVQIYLYIAWIEHTVWPVPTLIESTTTNGLTNGRTNTITSGTTSGVTDGVTDGTTSDRRDVTNIYTIQSNTTETSTQLNSG
ncbi:hypothetical protein Bhyg_12890, partial [Pseudolycoriella hygida]